MKPKPTQFKPEVRQRFTPLQRFISDTLLSLPEALSDAESQEWIATGLNAAWSKGRARGFSDGVGAAFDTSIKAYAGFTDDKLDYGWDRERDFHDGHYGIFNTKKEARDKYSDVRPVLITPSPPRRRQGKEGQLRSRR